MESKPLEKSNIAETLELDAAPGGPKRRKTWIIIAVLVLLAVIAAAVILKMTGTSDGVQYKTQEATLGDLTVIVTATGTLQPTNKVDVGSELSGIVKSVEVDFNDRVKVGQILARLETSRLDAQITQAKASLAASKSKVRQAQATVTEARQKLAQLQNLRRISNNKIPAQADLDAAQATHERALADEGSARAAVAQAEAVLETYGTDMAKAIIRSPINGIVLNRSIEPGQTVAATLQAPTLFTLAEDLTKMELRVNVDEADIGKVAEGQKAAFSVSAYPDRAFKAQITQARYGSTTTSGVVTYETVLKVDNTDLALRPGMTATAEITVQNLEKVLLVPNAALRFTPPSQALKDENKASGGLVGSLLPRPPRIGTRTRPQAAGRKKQQQVWILKNGKPIAVRISIGSTNGSVTEVTAGDIKPGMAILVDFTGKTP
ncbi:MAG: efflux RND transporter periplasmic adaptor subunit [Deltaproteobacteria bacterium]|nr:efflux RND transporter periplasmic adaptor subunit [Deltaproteobacteria bacterium]